MGRAARERAMQHFTKAYANGGCKRGPDDGACDVCRHPPRLRPGDVIDFQRAGMTPTDDEQRSAQTDRERIRGTVAGVALVALLAAVTLARCAG